MPRASRKQREHARWCDHPRQMRRSREQDGTTSSASLGEGREAFGTAGLPASPAPRGGEGGGGGGGGRSCARRGAGVALGAESYDLGGRTGGGHGGNHTERARGHAWRNTFVVFFTCSVNRLRRKKR